MFELAKQPNNFANPKKGNLWDLNNSRRTAIGSALAKWYCLILLNRLKDRAVVSPISPNLIGFKKEHRTAVHVLCYQLLSTRS